MTIVGLRRFALWMGLVMMTACGGPLPEEMGTSELVSQEEVSVENEAQAESQLACPYQGAQSCRPGYNICAAFCCNGVRHRTVQACGNCLTYALNECSNEGGLWRIEWHDV